LINPVKNNKKNTNIKYLEEDIEEEKEEE